jgi:hypothetical protein
MFCTTEIPVDSLSDPTQGIEAALTTMSDLEELYGLPKPAAGKPKTPTIPTLTPEQVRANPKIKRWRTTDGRIMSRP